MTRPSITYPDLNATIRDFPHRGRTLPSARISVIDRQSRFSDVRPRCHAIVDRSFNFQLSVVVNGMENAIARTSVFKTHVVPLSYDNKSVGTSIQACVSETRKLAVNEFLRIAPAQLDNTRRRTPTQSMIVRRTAFRRMRFSVRTQR